MPRTNAFKAGYAAYLAALALTACPMAGPDAAEWEAGWIKAAGY